MKVKEIGMLRQICGVTRMGIIKNEYIRSLDVKNIAGKMRDNRLR